MITKSPSQWQWGKRTCHHSCGS